MMKFPHTLLGAVLLCGALPAWATVCQNADGVAKDISYDLSNVFDSSNNKPGQIVTLAQKSGLVGVNAICPKGLPANGPCEATSRTCPSPPR
jgi:minor fimbrial subunit